MNESFLHFIWKFRLFDSQVLFTGDGEKVEVLSPGLQNNGAGPDFTNVQIRIGDTLWAGNVEIHVKSSQWESHRHHTDEAYNNVILHVVYEDDKETFTTANRKIPVVRLVFNPKLYDTYLQLNAPDNDIACKKAVASIDIFRLQHFLSRLLVERLERKTNNISFILENTQNDWLAVFYQLLFRAFGFGNNAEPFQQLAQNIPTKVIEKYSVRISQTEALLFGQAGFLNDETEDAYYQELQSEYRYIQKAHNLQPLNKSIWKFGGLRPVNFPTIRIAQLAALLSNRKQLLTSIQNFKSIEELHMLFNCTPSTYWDTHYTFGKESKQQPKPLGIKSIDKLIINMVVPFVFAYTRGHNYSAQEEKEEKTIGLLENLPAESNSVTDSWKDTGIKIQNAFHSQAFLQLKQNYCDTKRCLNCHIGKLIIQQTML